MNIKVERCINAINFMFGEKSEYKTDLVYIQDDEGVRITKGKKVFLIKVNDKNYTLMYNGKSDTITNVKSIPSWIVGLQRED